MKARTTGIRRYGLSEKGNRQQTLLRLSFGGQPSEAVPKEEGYGAFLREKFKRQPSEALAKEGAALFAGDVL